MNPKLLTVATIAALRRGAFNPQGWALQRATARVAVRCRCCGAMIEAGEKALFIHLSFSPRFTFGPACWLHRDCDPSAAGDEERHEIAHGISDGHGPVMLWIKRRLGLL